MEILQELGADKPFNNKGNYTDDGLIVYEKLLRIIDGLDCIGAFGNSKIRVLKQKERILCTYIRLKKTMTTE